MTQKLFDIIDKYYQKHGSLFIDGIYAYVIDEEGFYGPNSLMMGYATMLSKEFDTNITKFLEGKNTTIDRGNLYNDDYIEQLYKNYCKELKIEFDSTSIEEFRSDLDMVINECLPGTVYFVVNAGEYIDLEEATKETASYTSWESLEQEEIETWIDDLENALSLEIDDMIE